MPDKSITWGDAALPYDIGVIFSGGYVQQPACNYPLSYNIYYEDVTQAPGALDLQNPPEIQYSSATTTFKIEKCSAAQMPFTDHYDPDCLLTPYQKVWRIHFHVSLDGEPNGAFNNDVSFEVVIGNVCEEDSISFTSLVPSFTYDIKTSPNTMTFTDSPIVVQDKVVCPVVCQLKTSAGIDIPSGLGITFTSPVFSLTTDNKALNGQSIDLQITCVAPLSKTGPGGAPSSAVNRFTVQYRDECYDTKITPASRTSYTASLYKLDTKLYSKSS